MQFLISQYLFCRVCISDSILWRWQFMCKAWLLNLIVVNSKWSQYCIYLSVNQSLFVVTMCILMMENAKFSLAFSSHFLGNWCFLSSFLLWFKGRDTPFTMRFRKVSSKDVMYIDEILGAVYFVNMFFILKYVFILTC
jgi:hypothetical protein